MFRPIIAAMMVLLAAELALIALFHRPISCYLYVRSSHADQIAYLEDGAAKLTDLDGRGECQVSAAADYTGVAWSPVGRQLALYGEDGRIDLLEVETRAVETVVAETTGDAEAKLSWSPDGAELAYLQHGDGGSVWAVDIESGDERLIVGQVDVQQLSWSPTGDHLALVNGGGELLVVAAGGGVPAVLTAGVDRAAPPAWSPDGQRLAYVTGGGEVAVAGVEGGAVGAVTGFGEELAATARAIRWSPVGDQLAVEVTPGDGAMASLYLVDAAAGSSAQPLVAEPDAAHVSWTADGERLVFSRTLGDDGVFSLGLMDRLSHRLASGIRPDPRPAG